MLVISGNLPIRAYKVENARIAAIPFAALSKAEAGCQIFEINMGVSDPLTWRVFEVWDSADALQAHFESAHFMAFGRALPDLVSKPPALTRYEVSEALPLVL